MGKTATVTRIRMAPVYIARHGETQSNTVGRYAGLTAEGLTTRGRRQVEALAVRLRGSELTAIWASELVRAVETAQIISRRLDRPLRLDSRLNEIRMGPWEGLTEAEVAATFPKDFQLWQEEPDRVALPGRETLAILAERVAKTVEEARAESGPVLLISHVAPIRVALLVALSRPLRLYKRLSVRNADCFRLSGEDPPVVCRVDTETLILRELGVATT